MTLVVLMIGLFSLIYMKKPILFSRKAFDYVFLTGYLILLVGYIVNTTFLKMMSDKLFLIVTIAFVAPVFIRFVAIKKREF